MPEFKVEFQSYTTFKTIVEADSPEEARKEVLSDYCSYCNDSEVTGGDVEVNTVTPIDNSSNEV